MYKEYLGEGYHERIRKMLTADEALLPDRIIDAEANIGAMKRLIAPALEHMKMFGRTVDNEQKFNQLTSIAIYYLCGILCNAMKSRTSAPPYDVPRYKKKWDKKRDGYMQKGNLLMKGLFDSARDSLKKDAFQKVYPSAKECGLTESQTIKLIDDLADEL